MKFMKLLSVILSAAISFTACVGNTDTETPKSDYDFRVKNTVSLSDVVTDDLSKAENNALMINNAIKKANDYTEIVLPEGTVYIDDDIKFSSKENIFLTGAPDGTTLVNTSYVPPSTGGKHKSDGIFKIDKCENIRIENLTVDYLNPSTCDGIITEIKNGKTYFEIFPEFISGERNAVVGGENVFSVLIADDKVFTTELWPNEGTRLTKESDTLFSVPVSFGSPGMRICCRISNGSYASPAIFITNTSGLFLKNITCRSCPSAFIYGTYGNADFDFSGITVSVKDGSAAMLASNEDCMHIKNLRGFLNIRDCSFSGIGDDALNTHTKMGILRSVSENKAEVVMGRDNYPFPNECFRKGDIVEFFNSSYKSLGKATVVKYSGKVVEFDSIPEGVKEGHTLQNITESPTVTVENCNVNFGRARGFLIQAKNAKISGCTFENLRLSAILAAPDFEYWYEAGFTDKLEITGNTFKNCTNAVKDNGFAVVHINSSHDEVQNKVNLEGHKDVTVTDNVFEDCQGRHIRATSTVKANIQSETGEN